MKNLKETKGITLIALIITIIVMLILVGVSVSVAINTGLFTTASGVSKNTEVRRDEELERANGTVNLGGKDTGIQEYVDVLTGKKEAQDEQKKEEGYTHKMTITVKKDADGNLDANGTVNEGTYEYYIKESVTKRENLLEDYSNDFSMVNGNIMFLNEFKLISTFIYWNNWDDDGIRDWDYGQFEALGDYYPVFIEDDGSQWNGYCCLSIGAPEDADLLTSEENNMNSNETITPELLDEGRRESLFDGKCPFIDFTFTKL